MRAPKQLISAELQSIVQPTVVNHMIENYPATEAVNLKHVLSKDDDHANQEIIGEKDSRAHNQSAQNDQSMDEVSVESDDFFIDTIVSHETNRDKRHLNAKTGDTLYRFRWVG